MKKYYVGIDVGGMSIKAGLVDEDGKIIYKETCKTMPERANAEVIHDMNRLCESVISGAGVDPSAVRGVGIGIPGTVNGKKGVVSYAANLNFKKVNVIEEFEKGCGLPAFIGNDANCAALGETLFGSGGGKKNSILVTLGTGIGTGFILNGEILEGRNGEGAEGGHICIKMNGEKCTCGERGCWEAYASATALIRQTACALEKYPDSIMHGIVKDMGKVSGRTAFIAAKEGDKAGKKVVRCYVKASLGNDAGIIGAAALAMK